MRHLFILIGLLCALTVRTIAQQAQLQSVPQTIMIGENKPGEFTADAPAVFVLATDSAIVNIQVLAITPFTPLVRVINPTGVMLVTAQAETDAAILSVNAALPTPGGYRIEVSAAAGSGVQSGQFVISVEFGEVLPPPAPLTPGTAIVGAVEPGAPAKSYTFSAAPDARTRLIVRGDSPAPITALRDASSGDMIAFAGVDVIGAVYLLAAGETAYVVDVLHSGSSSVEGYTLCVELEYDREAMCPPDVQQEATAEPEATAEAESTAPMTAESTAQLVSDVTATPLPAGSCAIASAVGVFVYVRAEPSLNAAVLGQLEIGTSAHAVGISADGIWWQVETTAGIGWVSGAVTFASGDCTGLSIVTP